MSKINVQDSKHQKMGMAGLMSAQKPKNVKQTFVKFVKSIKKRYFILFGIALIFAVLGVVLQIQIPKMLGNATTEIFKQWKFSKDGFSFSTIKDILILCGIFYILANIFDIIKQWFMSYTSLKITANFRNLLKRKINTLPISYFDNHPNGNIMSVVMNDMDNIATTLQQGISQAITSIIMFFGILTIMISISWQLTLIAFLIVPGSLFVVKKLAPKARNYQKAYMQQLGKLNNHIEESYNGQMIIKSFNAEQEYVEKFKDYNAPLFEGWKAKFLGGLMMPSMFVVKNIGYVFVAVAGGWKVANGKITIGDMQAFLQYTSQFTQPVAQIAGIVSNLLSTVASAERIFEILDEPDMDTVLNTPKTIKEAHQKIDFEQVQFGYTDQPVIKDFNLSVKEGSLIAIVGHTGAGKTTLIHLLERFYDVQGGGIYIDGVDLRDIDREQLHSRIAMVLQDIWMFSGSIQENIMYGNPSASKEEFKNVTHATYVDEFVHRLPNGYETLLNESATNISQGQSQLISIARALLANPEILILDEATSNVDTRTELLIQKALKTLMKGRTSFIIAHRLSTIKNADQILVMEKGSIVEMGKHEELLSKNGVYAEIYHSQFFNQAV